MPDTKERPIIFNARSIRAILRGDKTQTRRILKPQPPGPTTDVEVRNNGGLTFYANDGGVYVTGQVCPYGKPGDVLWVREAFRFPEQYDHLAPSEYVAGLSDFKGAARYEADCVTTHALCGYDTAPSENWGRLRPSIHMPYDLVRLRLRVEEVRVERIQDISASDCAAEGISDEPSFPTDNPFAHSTQNTMLERLRNLWNDIHGDGAWARNDWVFAVAFSRINAN